MSSLKEAPTEELLKIVATSTDGAALGEAVLELIQRNRGLVYAIALKFAGEDKSLADDIFQETFKRLLVWVRKGRVVIRSVPRLLGTFARRSAIDLVSKRHRTPEIPVEAPPDKIIDRLYAEELMSQLPERVRSVLELTILKDMSSEEAASLLGMTANHIRQLKKRALEAIRNHQRSDERQIEGV